MRSAPLVFVALASVSGCAGAGFINEDVDGGAMEQADLTTTGEADLALPEADLLEDPNRDVDLGGLGDAGDGSMPDGAVPGFELNPNWIGGACASANDCNNNSPTCLTNGFPNGMCTQACTMNVNGTWVCPDEDLGPTTPYSVSRCIATPTMPRCVGGCDFDKSETGCRPGYTCVLRQRAGRPNDIFPVCLPSTDQRWPGEPAPTIDIGGPCTKGSDCASLSCLPLTGGYCTKTMCDWAGCPNGSKCFSINNGEQQVCIKTCMQANECRTNEGYDCDVDNTCWPVPQQGPTWDPTVGTGDCSSAWNAGLSPCDTKPDSYVVVHKSKRNLALCESGQLVMNHNIGLGFAPLGTKTRSGDGKTPEGVYFIPRLVPNSSYYKAFLIGYPGVKDATDGFAAGTITMAQRDAILQAQKSCLEPPQMTSLGGLVEIHGGGGGQDWTFGCVALDNMAVDQLWMNLGLGDTVVIVP